MEKNEIKEFVSESIRQIKSALPKGCVLDGKFDFDISVITTKETGGKIGIKLAGIGHTSNTQQLHRIRFSITDEKSQAKNLKQGIQAFKRFIGEVVKLDEVNKSKGIRYKKSKRRKNA